MSMRVISTFLLSLAALAACQRDPKTTYKAERVTKGPISEVVSATGEVSAVITVNVGSQLSGTISKLHVDFNSIVKQGQLLAELDPRLFQAARERAAAGLAAADADVERARVALVDARRTEQRTATLLQKGLVAAADMDAALAAREGAEAALKAAQARVLQARADRDTAAMNVALCEIRSPIDGIVISRAIDVGQTVAASLQSPTLFLIANDLGRMQILANIDEADVGKVKEGLTARFGVDAYPGEVFKGRIREIRQAPNTIQNVVTYAAVIDAPNPDRKLRQGMTAAVRIMTRERAEALRVPNTALRYRPGADKGAGDRPDPARVSPVAVARADEPARARPKPDGDATETRPGARSASAYRLEQGRAVPVTLVLGISDGHRTEVLAGLSEGDEVVVGESGASAGVKRAAF
jgi:HlyD family secretion protein